MEDFYAEKNHWIWGWGITDPPKDMECRRESWMVMFNDVDLWATKLWMGQRNHQLVFMVYPNW